MQTQVVNNPGPVGAGAAGVTAGASGAITGAAAPVDEVNQTR